MRNAIQCDDCRKVTTKDDCAGWLTLTVWLDKFSEGNFPFFGETRDAEGFDFCSVRCLESWTQARRLIGEVSNG